MNKNDVVDILNSFEQAVLGGKQNVLGGKEYYANQLSVHYYKVVCGCMDEQGHSKYDTTFPKLKQSVAKALDIKDGV